MHRLYAITLNTFREAVRDRVLLGALSVAAFALLLALVVAELSLDQQLRVVEDLGLAIVSLFSVLVAVFLGSSLLYKEIERKTLYMILPRPLYRHEFLLGKYLGILLTLAVLVALMGALLLYLMSLQRLGATALVLATPPVFLGAFGLLAIKVSDRAALLVPLALLALAASLGLAHHAGAPVGVVAGALALTTAEVAIVIAVALLFSSFSTPFLTGALTLGTWVVGRAADTMVELQGAKIPEAVRGLVTGALHVVPNLSLYVPPRDALAVASEGHGGPLGYVANALAYAGLYSAVVLVLAALVFRRRDFL
jgi:Cu-processing system permease protein